MKNEIDKLILLINNLPNEQKILEINKIKIELHKISPMRNEPVDCVLWVKAENVQANDYNPNSVAPPEMELLRTSISNDGYTQPIVTYPEGDIYTVVDGFHRNRVGKECKEIRERILGYLPVTAIRPSQEDKGNRIASTIRHNRARGKHKVESMSDIVIELKNRNWTNDRIGRELGMDEDEVLRLCQITGLAGLFKDEEFSKSWDIKDSVAEEFVPLTDDFDEKDKEAYGFRTTNTDDANRIFHTHDKWECFKAGFYSSTKEGMNKEQCEEAYRDFLSDEKKFKKALREVINNWKYSCEHYLTNNSMNRIAWLGQAALCIALGIPSVFRSGFNLLTEDQQIKANNIALEYLNKWLVKNNREKVNLEQAMTDKQTQVY